MFVHEERQAMRLLEGLENATLSTSDLKPLFEAADPALVALLFGWLRAWYHPGHSAAEGVTGRIVDLCAASPKVARMAREGKADPLVAWFEESYDYRDLGREEFIPLIVEKLEG